MDEENIANDETVVASNKAKAADYANMTTDKWTDSEESQDSSSCEEVNPIPEEISLHITAVTPIRIIVRRDPPAVYIRSSAWDTLAQANNLQELAIAATIFDKTKVCRAVECAISNSGATVHFLVKGSPVVNKQPVTNPLKITLPNGKVIPFTHTCNLNIIWLLDQITEVHIVPGLAHASLILTHMLCDAGYNVVFDMAECRVYYK